LAFIDLISLRNPRADTNKKAPAMRSRTPIPALVAWSRRRRVAAVTIPVPTTSPANVRTGT
jgi:hypothetical protein